MITIQEIRDKEFKINMLDNLEIKHYLPLVQKIAMVDNIVDICTLETDGIKKVNYILKKFAIDFAFLNQYTNIDLSDIEDVYELYDELSEYGVFTEIIKNINEHEVFSVLEAVDFELEQYLKLNNSIEGIIATGINKLIEKIPNEKAMKKLFKSVSKDLAQFDPSKVEVINTINEILNTKK